MKYTFVLPMPMIILFCSPSHAQNAASQSELTQSTATAAGRSLSLPQRYGRELAFQALLDGASPLLADTTAVDTFPPAVKPKLLPENMSFVEDGLWGESGLLRKIGIASALTPEVRKHELAVRRTMLSIHQVAGFVTLGLMATTDYFGQKSLDQGLRHDRDMHQAFVTATIISYSTTALLAVLSPPPLIRRDETSRTTIHKTLAWVHFAGMILTPLLAPEIRRRGSLRDEARFHQISAYFTTAVLAASMIVMTF